MMELMFNISEIQNSVPRKKKKKKKKKNHLPLDRPQDNNGQGHFANIKRAFIKMTQGQSLRNELYQPEDHGDHFYPWHNE